MKLKTRSALGAVLVMFALVLVCVLVQPTQAQAATVSDLTLDAANDISKAVITGINTEIDVSKDNKQTPILSLNGKQLELNTDYVVWYYNTASVGTAKMLIIGIGNYTGYIEKEYAITGAYNVTIGESVEIYSGIPVKINFGRTFDEVEIYYDQGKLFSLDKEEAESFFSKNYFFTTQSNDTDGVADWYIKLYKLETEYGWRWNGSAMVQTVTTKRNLIATSHIAALHSPVTKLSWAGTQPIVHKDKVFIQPDIYPAYSYDQELTWHSSDESVATVDTFGVVTILKAGTCTITAYTENGLRITQELSFDAMDIKKVTSFACSEAGTGEYQFEIRDKYGVMKNGTDYEVTYEVNGDIIYATFTGIGLYRGTVTKCFDIANNLIIIDYNIPGDIDGNDAVTQEDAVYLLRHTIFGETLYPLNNAPADIDGNGSVNKDDAVYLLLHTMFGEQLYPINTSIASETPAPTAQSATMSISSSSGTVYRGDTITVTVSTTAAQNCISGGLLFNYNTNVFEYVSGSATLGGYTSGVSTAAGNVAGFFMNGDETVQGNIFQIILKVKDTAAFGTYTISGTPNMTSADGAVSCNTGSASVTVACKHSYGDWSKVNDTQHKHICSVCQKEETVNHTWNSGTITKQPSYNEDGEKRYTCTGCGATRTETVKFSGWAQLNGKWVYYENGAKVTNDWRLDSKGWCYLTADGTMATNEWIMDSVGWCYVGSDGYCVTNSWMKDSTGWCYLDAEGRMVYNQWVKDSTGWCYVGSSGYMVYNQWVQDSTGWCYVDSSGYMVYNQWVKDSHGWCYVGESGYMVTNRWVQDSKGWCYIGSNGYAVTNCWKRDSVGWCYLDGEGSMVKNNWVYDNGKWYWLDSNGYMIANTSRYIGGKTYYFNASGICTNP